MGSPEGTSRGAGALSGIMGAAVIIVSAVLMAQSLGFKSELGYIFGYQLPNIGPASGYYNRNTYNFFGYELDPLIGISSGGVVIGILQLVSCFFLCCGRRSLSIGWAVFQMLLLIGVVIIFALAIYFEVYSYRTIPGYGILGVGRGIGLDYNSGSYLNPGLINNPYAQQQLLQNQGYLYNQQVGLGGLGNYPGNYRNGNRYIGDYFCNPTGQGFVGVFGVDIVVIIVAMVMVGVASRQSSISDEYVRASPRMDVRNSEIKVPNPVPTPVEDPMRDHRITKSKHTTRV